MKLKHLFAILMSLILVFSFGGCIFTNDSGENLKWDSRSSYFEIEKGANGVVTVSYKIKEGKDNSVYADVSDYDDPETYINLTLAADVATKTQVVIKYRESGENKTASVNIKIEEESEVFSFDLTKITKKGTLKTISLYPKYDKTSGSGELKIEKVKFSDECNEDNEFIMKESTSSDNGGNTVTPTNPTDVIDVNEGQEEMLYAKYKDYFRIGMVANADREGNYTSYSKIESEFNSFTCENEMKMYTIGNNQGSYDYGVGDSMVSYMVSRQIKVRGHALIWYNGCPSWLSQESDKTTLLSKIDTYCYNVVKHYADKFGENVYCWDVVNEAVADGWETETISLSSAAQTQYGANAKCNGMRSDFWSVAGIDYIKTAFNAAKRALNDAGCPNVKLYYNDYSITNNQSKKKRVYDLVAKLIEDGVPIDGVGFQSHYDAFPSNTNETEQAIQDFINLGKITNHSLEISITELDVKTSDNTALADFYGKLFAVYRKYASNIASVTLWGVADDYTWLNKDGSKNYPFLFDSSQNKKQAYYSVYNF